MAIRASVVEDPAAIDRFFAQEEQGGLSERGRWEAQRVAERLAAEPLDGLYSSPLFRARETAEVVAERLGMPVQRTPHVTELRTGKLVEGSLGARWVGAMANAPLRPRLKRAVLGGSLIPLYFFAWRRGRTVGGESPAELVARIRSLLAELEASHPPGSSVALFSHGYLMVTVTWMLGPRGRLALARRPYIPNGGITEMELRQGRLHLVRHADCAHLRAAHPRTDRG